MDINELQNQIFEFQFKRFSDLNIDLTDELIFTHLAEEVGEIARQLINKKYPNFRKYNANNLKEEIAQAMLDLFVLSKLNNIDIQAECINKLELMKLRAKT